MTTKFRLPPESRGPSPLAAAELCDASLSSLLGALGELGPLSAADRARVDSILTGAVADVRAGRMTSRSWDSVRAIIVDRMRAAARRRTKANQVGATA